MEKTVSGGFRSKIMGTQYYISNAFDVNKKTKNKQISPLVAKDTAYYRFE